MARAPKKSHIPDFRGMAKRLRKVAREESWQSVYDFAEAERDNFADRILAQDFEDFRVIFYPESGTNLSPQWLRRKEKAGADLRTMLATHHYLRSIGVFTRRDRKGLGTVRVGFHHSTKARNLKGETVNILLKDMARVHEFGSEKANIPARRHWRPHLRVMRERAPMVRREIRDRIVARMRRT